MDLNVPTGSEGEDSGRAGRRTQARQRLLAAAKEVFEEVGFHPARVDDIAARAGVSHGSFYNYFKSKQDIFRALAQSIDQDLEQTESFLAEGDVTAPQEGMRLAIRRNFERFRRDARIMDVIAEVCHIDAEVAKARRNLHDRETIRLAKLISVLQRNNVADRRLNPDIAATALTAMAWRFKERWFITGEIQCDFETGVEQFFQLVLNALGMKRSAR